MIYRSLFMGYAENPEEVCLRKDCSCYGALAFDGNRLFLYVESNEETVDPEMLVDGDLLLYPNGKHWERGVEIFHYSVPMNELQWERKVPKEPFFQLNQLKPEKISSYIYYHYQYQEEYPGDWDKYGSIYLFGDLLVFYLENPTEPETVKTIGLLTTKNTPIDTWDVLMEEHFADHWRPIEVLDRNAYIAF